MDLNKVNPKAAESLKIVAIWKKKRGWLQRYFIEIYMLIYIYMNIISSSQQLLPLCEPLSKSRNC